MTYGSLLLLSTSQYYMDVGLKTMTFLYWKKKKSILHEPLAI